MDEAYDESGSEALDAEYFENQCLQRRIEGRDPRCGPRLRTKGRCEAVIQGQRAADPAYLPSPCRADFFVPVSLANNKDHEPEQEGAARNRPQDLLLRVGGGLLGHGKKSGAP